MAALKTLTIKATNNGESPTVKVGKTFTYLGELWAVTRPVGKTPSRTTGWKVTHVETTFSACHACDTMADAEATAKSIMSRFPPEKIHEAITNARKTLAAKA